MHTKLIESATHEQLKKFLFKQFEELKHADKEMYEELEMNLYICVNGEHFNEHLLNKALSCMENEDGTKGGHWNLEQTNSVAKQYGISFNHFNEFDFNYVMNMIYSDYYGVFPNETTYYVKMAEKFLKDKDAPDGKALKYYLAMEDID